MRRGDQIYIQGWRGSHEPMHAQPFTIIAIAAIRITGLSGIRNGQLAVHTAHIPARIRAEVLMAGVIGLRMFRAELLCSGCYSLQQHLMRHRVRSLAKE